MRFGILGPLEVGDGDHPLRLGGRKLRTLLAALLVHANEVVSADRLASALWSSSPAHGGLNALRTQVSRLRATIDPPTADPTDRRLVRQGPGYLLRVGRDELDAFVFEAMSRRSRDALAAGGWQVAEDTATRALACWRGRAFDEFAQEEFAEARSVQLEERRLLTAEGRIDAGLALGRHRALISDLEELIAHDPLREPLWCQLILALYRADRQSDALRAYDRVRRLLAEQLGINPCAELVRLERAVLEQDPSLAWHGQGPEPLPDLATSPSGPVGEPQPTQRPVTFLVTEVEPSSALWTRDPAAMRAALRAQDAVVHKAIESHGGRVFGRPSDGFSAVFDRAADAIAAAMDGQLRPSTVASSVKDPLRVRMAIHTGDAERREGNFFGPAIRWVSRMRDAAYGGQVLVSAATRELVLDALPRGVQLTDIGTWLFDGFSRAERVYQLDHPDLGTGFPPLRSGHRHTGTIPRHATSFVGRRRAYERTVAELLASQLVTITGEGGIGKTRLALEVAERADPAEYPDGVWFCDASSVDDADGLTEEMANALRLVTPVGTDVRGELVASLQRARLLLVVDNSERHRAVIAELVEEILASGSESKILATGRAPLRVRGEQVIQLDPLALPASAGGSDPAEAPAVRLLIDRAKAAGATVTGDDPALVEIVQHLDGIPLAIELAAPRLATMSTSALATRLDRRFGLLAGPTTMPARQRTLWANIDWSFNLLGSDAQRLFGALSVFRGGWTLDTAEIVTAAVDLESDAAAMLVGDLAEHSMVRADLPGAGTVRYRMLDTMRAYATDQLVKIGRRPEVSDRHAEHFIELAETAVPYRRGPLEPAWVGELDTEFDNMRAAYQWTVESNRPADGLRLVAALADDVIMRERLEIGRWAEELAGLPAVTEEPLLAVSLAVASNTALVEGRLEDARRLSLMALEAERATDSPPGWIARNTLALLALAEVDAEGWREHLRTMAETSQVTGDPLAAAVADYERVLVFSVTGQPGRGVEAAERLLELGATCANPSILAMGNLAHGWAIAVADPELALREYQEALTTASSAHNTLLVQQSLRAIEELDARSGDRTAALTVLRTMARRFERAGNVSEQLQTVISILDSLVAVGALSPAATLCGGLTRTPWRLTAACRLIDRTVAEKLDREQYVMARRAGATMSPTELVAFASATIQDVAG